MAGTDGRVGGAGGSGAAGGGNVAGQGAAGSGGSQMGGSSGVGGDLGGAGAGGASEHPCGPSKHCEVSPNVCCGYCSASTISQWMALAEEDYNAYQSAHCGGIACACANPIEMNYAGVCRSGECTAVDLSVDELSACTTDDDCRLRAGADCCERCDAADPSELVAVNKTVNISAALCGSALPPCCAPSPYPATAQAVCTAGHCAVSTDN